MQAKIEKLKADMLEALKKAKTDEVVRDLDDARFHFAVLFDIVGAHEDGRCARHANPGQRPDGGEARFRQRIEQCLLQSVEHDVGRGGSGNVEEQVVRRVEEAA